MAASGMVAYGVHYGSAKIYNMLCVPDGVMGFIQGLIANGSPWCQAGLLLMSHTQSVYASVILVGLSRTVIGMITGS